LKVLHLFSTGGIALILAKFQRKILGYSTLVYTRKHLDPFDFGSVYRQHTRYCLPDKALAITVKSLFLALFFDVIHVHSSDKIAYLIKKLLPKVKVVLHYHGTKIRGNWRSRRKYWRAVDAVVVSTNELLKGAPTGTQHVPNPVDTDLFRDLKLERRPKALLMVKHGRKCMWKYIKPVADSLRKELDIDYEVLFCDEKPIPYGEMPRVLNRYEWFFDIPHGYNKNEKIINALSATGLQALACGCKVATHWSNEPYKKLPEEHKPEYATEKLSEIYQSL